MLRFLLANISTPTPTPNPTSNPNLAPAPNPNPNPNPDPKVLRFLLSNIAWFVTAYGADGFRFDAVSTALYRHRSLNGRGTFTSYHDYFGPACEVDLAALSYFKLANLLLHELLPAHLGAGAPPPAAPLLSIAEEPSGLPGLCAPLGCGGVGFDLRQTMGLPPLWAEICSLPHGASIPVARLAREMCRVRSEERRLAYSECHDHSLVGDKTLAFRLIGEDMYL